MALCPGLGSPAARQLLLGLGDRPLGTVPPLGAEQGEGPWRMLSRKSEVSDTQCGPRVGTKRRGSVLGEGQPTPAPPTQDKTQVPKQPWQRGTSHNRRQSYQRRPHTTSELAVALFFPPAYLPEVPFSEAKNKTKKIT